MAIGHVQFFNLFDLNINCEAKSLENIERTSCLSAGKLSGSTDLTDFDPPNLCRNVWRTHSTQDRCA